VTTLDVHVVRVFADAGGRFGNPLAVVFDAAKLSAELGVRLTAQLGFSETVFIDDLDRRAIRIFTPAQELKLAGHPVVGTAWVLARTLGQGPGVLRPRLAEDVQVWERDGLTWALCSAADAQPWDRVRLESPAAVDALPVPPGPDYPHHQFWAWIDEPAGLLRARNFIPALGVPEDEATGSAAVHLAQEQGRALTIRQGRGSVINARPAERAGWSEIGGRVVPEGIQSVTVSESD
jgi:predicted PhzF superfamily epimerase YddE/YHI9